MEGNSNMAEAERWLTIAEKLLNAHDFQGTKTFAIRARDSDPKLYAADQILAVADTLLAGESRINMANNQPNWYAILQLPQLTQNSELIATQYRKLALLLNPVKNKFAFVDQAFRLVSEAWSLLSNPSRKTLFDGELHLSMFGEKLPPPPQQVPEPAQQQQQPARKSPRKRDGKAVEEDKGPSLTESTRVTRPARPIRVTEPAVPSFWTACPYCYFLYEYLKVYEKCTLRCQNCQRAFHAVVIAPPPLTGEKDSYFCSWGFFPLGFNAKDKGVSSNWSPISTMFTCPLPNAAMNGSVGEGKRKVGRPKKTDTGIKPPPRIYYDDQEVYVEVSDQSDESDGEWESESRKKARNVKVKGMVGKSAKKVQQERKTNKVNQKVVVGDINVASDGNLDGGSIMQEGLAKSNAYKGDSSKKVAANSVKKQTGKGLKEWGQLDLNVEFSNEVEEPAQGMNERNGAGNGEEDNIEGIEFFEGLDEFLSSLPILVGDDKVKAS